MRLILSRKGFDSSAGGIPNPVFPDGRFIALPIPDPDAPLTYGDIHSPQGPLGNLLTQLTGDKHWPHRCAHLDPDLLPESASRARGWRPSLGQMGTAQAHLRNQGVQAGDLFLFFALFRAVEWTAKGWQFQPDARPFHAIWGWLQIKDAIDPATAIAEGQDWVRSHPHAHGQRGDRNTLYLAEEHLRLPDSRMNQLSGAGVWPALGSQRQLTAPDARRVTQWRLPAAFHPSRANGPPLTDHQALWRWGDPTGDWCALQAAARGQEFVLDLADYPEVTAWLTALWQ